MKKLTAILVSLLVLVTFAFVACDNKPQPTTLPNLKLPTLEDNQMVVVEKVSDEQYKYFTVTLEGKLSATGTLQDVLEYIRDTYSVVLEINDGFISKFDQIPSGAPNEYVFLYTSVAADFDTSAWVQQFDCDGVTVKTSAVGCKQMHVAAGCVIYISTVVYQG